MAAFAWKDKGIADRPDQNKPRAPLVSPISAEILSFTTKFLFSSVFPFPVQCPRRYCQFPPFVSDKCRKFAQQRGFEKNTQRLANGIAQVAEVSNLVVEQSGGPEVNIVPPSPAFPPPIIRCYGLMKTRLDFCSQIGSAFTTLVRQHPSLHSGAERYYVDAHAKCTTGGTLIRLRMPSGKIGSGQARGLPYMTFTKKWGGGQKILQFCRQNST